MTNQWPADPCEWDPENNRPAQGIPTKLGSAKERTGCPRRAEVVVGADGQWRLCRGCAELPRFNRFRVRRPVRRSPWGNP